MPYGALVDFLEKVVAFVIDENERGEIFHRDFPYGFHAEFGIGDDFLRANVILGQQRGWATRRAEVEAAVLVAGIGYGLRAIALGEHDHGAAVGLEKVNVGVHATSRGWSERATCHSFGSFGRTGIVDRELLEVVGQITVLFEVFFHLGVGHIAGDDDRTTERNGGRDGILAECSEGVFHAQIEVDFYALEFPVAVGLRNKSAGIFFEFFEENAVFGDLGFGLSICRAGNPDADRAGSAVTRQAYHADIEREVFSTKLRADTDVASHFKQFGFEFDIAKCLAVTVSGGGQGIEVFG